MEPWAVETAPQIVKRRQTLMKDGDGSFVLRYAGDYSPLSDTLIHVSRMCFQNRVAYKVECPFCDEAMDRSSLSKRRPYAREYRYKCVGGHRVSLVPKTNGALGWR
jgi:hypothetical protein